MSDRLSVVRDSLAFLSKNNDMREVGFLEHMNTIKDSEPGIGGTSPRFDMARDNDEFVEIVSVADSINFDRTSNTFMRSPTNGKDKDKSPIGLPKFASRQLRSSYQQSMFGGYASSSQVKIANQPRRGTIDKPKPTFNTLATMPESSPTKDLNPVVSVPTPVAEVVEASEKTSIKQEEEEASPVVSEEPIMLNKALSMVEE